MEQPIVKLQNVTKKIGKRTIIDQLSLDLPLGEVFGFLGPNGSGKTTTIRMMVGLMSLTAGEITIGGYSITKQYEKAIRQVGAIVENPEMYKYLSGYDNLIHYARMISGITEHRVHEVVKLVGLEGRIHDKVKTYSLGMRQRLGVAQAILHKPQLLILDEPTNGLDPAGIRELRDYLRLLSKEEGIAVFVSSHLLSEMELMCDRVAIIQNGKLIDVRNIRGEHADKVNNRVLIEVDRTHNALDILFAAGVSGVLAGENSIAVDADKESIAAINASLVAAGIKVYGIRAQVKTLEDQFLEVTGGERIG
ncbi:bacitracin ABC transporter ATP-binding protein [Paenibacillus sp. FSL H8-0548]|uniref:ABC transporter ATP-binding protein n=1 Tax=Paenibacillus sp. FSL H8-0548 TaxID=1920422 RepID=UPI00096FAF64|nr:ABC transporter ATP-binding protein [Paenibacillus sp. FSL H8-0548]OMF30861.1 bacitracin ABC transporter ATP-binding protein [Paenibacillus sp. FSL H8-0548]